jgi:hypothetical protein
MNKNNSLIGYFEQLPDEIILDLFENYIRLVDLYLGFYLLNHCRINRIINSAQFYIDIPSKDVFHTKSFSHFVNQIVSLHLSAYCHDLDLSKLINLRLLHIEKPAETQLLSIHADRLPNLSYLSLSPCWFSVDELPKHLTNLVELCSFKNLRFCILPNGKIFRFQAK